MSLRVYTLCQAAFSDRIVPKDDKGLSKLDVFGDLHINVNLKSINAFGCPIYGLGSKLASGKSIP